MTEPIAAFVSDIHLSDAAPRARSDDWFAAMAASLQSLRFAADWRVPLFIGGDLFHHWKPSPELLTLTLKNMPPGEVVAIVGNHDMPHHAPELLHKSGFATVVAGGGMSHAVGEYEVRRDDRLAARIVCIDYGMTAPPAPEREGDELLILLQHRFVWIPGAGDYPGCSPAGRAGVLKKSLAGYDVAVFGDNHMPFDVIDEDGPTIVNCGCLIPRRIVERDVVPSGVMVYADGSIERLTLVDATPSPDAWNDRVRIEDERPSPGPDFGDAFLRMLRRERGDLDFREAVRGYRATHAIDEGVAAVLSEVLDGEA